MSGEQSGRPKWVNVLLLVGVLIFAVSLIPPDDDAEEVSVSDRRTPAAAERAEKPDATAPEADKATKRKRATSPRDKAPDAQSGSRAGSSKAASPKPSPAKPSPAEASAAETSSASQSGRFLVARVIDGDTLELGNGQGVRLVGIDTPERGECGFDKATANLARLVQGKTVTLTRSDENADHYGRLLRYVNIGTTDAGLRLIKNGVAIARYDSRDGYGYHRREPVYIAAGKASPGIRCAPTAPPPTPQAPAPAGNCASGYSPCVPVYPPDVNCPDVDGPISVTGSDPHGLDADGDGVACE